MQIKHPDAIVGLLLAATFLVWMLWAIIRPVSWGKRNFSQDFSNFQAIYTRIAAGIAMVIAILGCVFLTRRIFMP